MTVVIGLLFAGFEYYIFNKLGYWRWTSLGDFLSSISPPEGGGLTTIFKPFIWVWNHLWIGFYAIAQGILYAVKTKEMNNRFTWSTPWSE